MKPVQISGDLAQDGFAIFNAVYSADEVNRMISLIEQVKTDKPNFRITNNLFAIRQFLK